MIPVRDEEERNLPRQEEEETEREEEEEEVGGQRSLMELCAFMSAIFVHNAHE